MLASQLKIDWFIMCFGVCRSARMKRCLLVVPSVIVGLSSLMLSGCNEIEFDDSVSEQRATIMIPNPESNNVNVDSIELSGNSTQPGKVVRLMAMNYGEGEAEGSWIEVASTISESVPQRTFTNFGIELYPYRMEFQPTDLAGTAFWPEAGVAYLKVDDGTADVVRSAPSTEKVVVSQEAAALLAKFTGRTETSADVGNKAGPGPGFGNGNFNNGNNNNNNNNSVEIEVPAAVKMSNFTTLVDPSDSPTPDLQFLTYKFTDPEDNTVGQPVRRRNNPLSGRELREMNDHGDEYYEAIGAFRRYTVKEINLNSGQERELRLDKSTLQNFKRLHGWRDDEIPVAVFYNGGDFGLGRRVRCMSKSDTVDVPMPSEVADTVKPKSRRTEVVNDPVAVICISENFGSVDGDVSLNRSLQEATDLNRAPFASVAMEYLENADGTTPNAIKFYVYLQDGSLLPLAILDSEGEKHFPEICTVCHGGEYDLVSRSITGSSYLPLAIPEFDYSNRNGFTQADQMATMRYINDLIAKAGATPKSVNLYIDAQRGAPMEEMTRATGSHGPIPEGWQDRPELYEKVFAPYCRACHQTSKLLPFETSASFVAV
ncbi:MAG: hypothetical protein P8176_06470 [Gammaproteobacteria bacterium]